VGLVLLDLLFIFVIGTVDVLIVKVVFSDIRDERTDQLPLGQVLPVEVFEPDMVFELMDASRPEAAGGFTL
jgi:hypothetical protein